MKRIFLALAVAAVLGSLALAGGSPEDVATGAGATLSSAHAWKEAGDKVRIPEAQLVTPLRDSLNEQPGWKLIGRAQGESSCRAPAMRLFCEKHRWSSKTLQCWGKDCR